MSKIKTAALLFAVGAAPFAAERIYYDHIADGAAARYARGDAIPFDEGRWHADWKHSRYFMVSDLLERYDFRGWRRDSVASLLGETSPTLDGFSVYAGYENPGQEYSPRSYDLMFMTDSRSVVEYVYIKCEGKC